MVNNIRVSIITVVRNGVMTIEQTIQSVLQQTYKNIEYIIIDGASTDGTQEIIKQYEKCIAYYISEPDGGIYDAMNKGIRQATGEIIGIINSDDWYERDAVEKIVEVFCKEDVEVVHGNMNIIGAEGDKWVRKAGVMEELWYHMAILHPTVFVKKNVYKQYGVFDTEYKIVADYELMLRLYTNNVKFIYLNNLIANFRTSGISHKQSAETRKEVLEVVNKYINSCEDNANAAMLIYKRKKLAIFEEKIEEDPMMLEEMLKEYFGEDLASVAIFGAGVWGKKYNNILQKTNIGVECFIDNNKNDRELFCKKEIRSLNQITNKDQIILIAVKNGADEIAMQLQSVGFINYVTVENLVQRYEELG